MHWATASTRRASTFEVKLPVWAPTVRKSRWAPRSGQSWQACCRVQESPTPARNNSVTTGPPAASIISTPTTRKNIDVVDTSKPKQTLPPRVSATFDQHTIAEIHRAAATGIYRIRGAGTKRKLPHFDDLLFLGASISRYPLEGYRERCSTEVTLGTRFAKKPIHLKIPVTIAGMSFGALSGNAKEALGRGATAVGTSTTTGDGGMTPEERGHSQTLV